MNEGAFVATVITVFTCVGMIVTVLWVYDWLTDRIAAYKRHKLWRKRQLERLRRYQTGDIRHEPIVIAQEYAAAKKLREQRWKEHTEDCFRAGAKIRFERWRRQVNHWRATKLQDALLAGAKRIDEMRAK